MTSTVEVPKISSKIFETANSYELDSTTKSLKEDGEDSNEKHTSKLQQAYNQQYKQSYKLVEENVKLSKSMKEALEEIDSLEKMNEDA